MLVNLRRARAVAVFYGPHFSAFRKPSTHQILENFLEINCGANGAPWGVFTRTPGDRPLVCDGGRGYVGVMADG